MSMSRNIGLVFRKARKCKNMTMEELANNSNLSYDTIQAFETGKKPLSFKKIDELANLLNLRFHGFDVSIDSPELNEDGSPKGRITISYQDDEMDAKHDLDYQYKIRKRKKKKKNLI